MFKEFDRRYEALTSTINKCDMENLMLIQMVERVIDPYKNFLGKTETIQRIERLRDYISEVESKASNEWYNHVGLLEKLKYHFSDQINSNKEDIVKILEILKE